MNSFTVRLKAALILPLVCLIGSGLSDCGSLFQTKEHVTLNYVSDNSRPVPKQRKLDSITIDIQDFTRTDERLDHLSAIISSNPTRVKHYDQYVWEQPPADLITKIFRDRFEAEAPKQNYTLAVRSVPKPTHIILGQIQEFKAIANESGCPIGVSVSIKIVLYRATEMYPSKVLRSSVYQRDSTLQSKEVGDLPKLMSTLVSGIVDDVVKDVVDSL